VNADHHPRDPLLEEVCRQKPNAHQHSQGNQRSGNYAKGGHALSEPPWRAAQRESDAAEADNREKPMQRRERPCRRRGSVTAQMQNRERTAQQDDYRENDERNEQHINRHATYSLSKPRRHSSSILRRLRDMLVDEHYPLTQCDTLIGILAHGGLVCGRADMDEGGGSDRPADTLIAAVP
jgi:hypothetical protein